MAHASVAISGNLTHDLEMRYTQNGKPMATTSVAVTRKWEDKEQTSYFDVVIWGPMAENASASLHKGDAVVIDGRLEQRSWDAPDGSKRYKVEVVATAIGPSLQWNTAQVVRSERTSTPRQAPAQPVAADDYF